MSKVTAILMLSAILMLVAGTVLAAPSLPVTKPPVQPNPSWTGPQIDPHAVQGQWFKDLDTQEETVRPFEFHDNVLGHGGGSKSYLAIRGYATNIVYGGAGTPGIDPIVSFDINATIENDMPTTSMWAEGTNSHNEYTNPRDQYEGTMYKTKLTGEFSIDATLNLPNPMQPPYRDTDPHIVAENHDQLGWYCWTPENPEDKVPWGDYYVPTWDFGDIPQGGTANRLLQFTVDGGGLPSTDSRYIAIQESEAGADILLNRTTSLKISTWQDDLVLDTGIPYPDNPLRGSDVSVFHDVPEPATMSLLVLGGIGVLVKRRRK